MSKEMVLKLIKQANELINCYLENMRNAIAENKIELAKCYTQLFNEWVGRRAELVNLLKNYD